MTGAAVERRANMALDLGGDNLSAMSTLAQPRTTSTKAVVGFIFAFLVAPLGLALSLWALPETHSGRRGGYGLAIAGVVIGGLSTAFLLALIVVVRQAT